MMVLAALISAWATRLGPRLTRASDIEKQYLELHKLDLQQIKELNERVDELEDLLEKERDACREHIQVQRDACNTETDALRMRIQELSIEVVRNSGYKVEYDRANEKVMMLERQLQLPKRAGNGDDVIR